MNTVLSIVNTLLIMTYVLPPLPYALDALEPAISRETLEYHYGKHHQAYVNNLNNLVPGSPYENMTLDELVMKADGPIFNNAAQVWNHTFYFNTFSPNPKKEPGEKLAAAIKRDFGSMDTFKEQFNKAANSLFGSGWAWLVTDDSGRLSIVSESNAGNPLRSKGLKPLMTCDVWEHAYYIDYRNLRADYVKNFWNILDWSVVDERYSKI